MLPDKPTDRSVTRNGITYTQNTANIGKRPKSAISAAGLPVRWTFTPSLAKRVKHDGTQEDGANDGRDPHQPRDDEQHIEQQDAGPDLRHKREIEAKRKELLDVLGPANYY